MAFLISRSRNLCVYCLTKSLNIILVWGVRFHHKNQQFVRIHFRAIFQQLIYSFLRMPSHAHHMQSTPARFHTIWNIKCIDVCYSMHALAGEQQQPMGVCREKSFINKE